jgi:very-short-patch-repair endonuclease
MHRPTTNRARILRAHLTGAERTLWLRLRAHQFFGAKFRRQHPIGVYVVDFCCPTAMLVVELDGGQHTPERDAARTRFLEVEGYTVVRFWNNEVSGNLEGVLTVLKQHLDRSGALLTRNR